MFISWGFSEMITGADGLDRNRTGLYDAGWTGEEFVTANPSIQ